MDISFIGEQIVLFIAGFTANILAALSGGGAGFVQLPVLIFMGFNFSLALGTHKVAVVALGLCSFTKNHSLSSLNKAIALQMLFIGGPAVALGSYIVIFFSDFWAELVLGLITIACVIYSYCKKEFGIENKSHLLTTKDYIIGGILVALTGLLSGSFSSGAGLVAIMVLVLFFKLDIKTAIHHSMVFVALIWNLIGAITIGSLGQIQWDWVPMLVLGAFLGGFTGTLLVKKCQTKFIKYLFQSVMVISGVLLLYKAYTHF